jgi:hypothetical protein
VIILTVTTARGSPSVYTVDNRDALAVSAFPVFASFASARLLDLRKNKLQAVPEELVACASLEDLYLDQSALVPQLQFSLFAKSHSFCTVFAGTVQTVNCS